MGQDNPKTFENIDLVVILTVYLIGSKKKEKRVKWQTRQNKSP